MIGQGLEDASSDGSDPSPDPTSVQQVAEAVQETGQHPDPDTNPNTERFHMAMFNRAKRMPRRAYKKLKNPVTPWRRLKEKVDGILGKASNTSPNQPNNPKA